jgi:hypothetical protein
MKLNQLLVASLLIGMLSCKSKTALDYSKMIVKMETELSADIAKVDKKVNEYIKAKKTNSAIIMCRQMEALAAQKLKEVQQMNAPKVAEGENFKRAAVRYFTYIRNIYSTFSKFTMAETEKEKATERKKLTKIIGEKNQIAEAMQAAQRRFAAANDFQIEKVNDD